MAKEWYVLRVASGRESTVRGALLKKIQLADLEEQVPTVLVPTERVSEIKGGKKRFKERKLYPGYIIVEMELSDEVWYLIKDTHGIGDFVGSYQDLEEAREQVERINDDDPQLQAFVGQRQEDNPYYPVIVGGEDAYLPLDEARQLQNGVERTGLVKESYLSSYENRLPPIAPSE